MDKLDIRRGGLLEKMPLTQPQCVFCGHMLTSGKRGFWNALMYGNLLRYYCDDTATRRFRHGYKAAQYLRRSLRNIVRKTASPLTPQFLKPLAQ